MTGSSGLIGSAVVEYFGSLGWSTYGMDNNMRADFLGPEADTRWNQRRLTETLPTFRHHEIDIRDRAVVASAIDEIRPQLIVHAAAQPSHDLSASRPVDTWDVNATGTVNLLEAVRQHTPDSAFVFMSTNKVYGDGPNTIDLAELPTRWDYGDDKYRDGISETFSVDHTTHSVFGASKLAADTMVQEYGRYLGLKTCCLRGGCLTGARHSAVELHGFLNYLIRCNVEERGYTIFGYKGKQVRDNIHAFDVAAFIHEYWKNPRSGEVYNIGGGRENSCSLVEAIEWVEAITGKQMKTRYDERARVGDHICYISDLGKARAHYPDWRISRALSDIFIEISQGMMDRHSVRSSATAS